MDVRSSMMHMLPYTGYKTKKVNHICCCVCCYWRYCWYIARCGWITYTNHNTAYSLTQPIITCMYWIYRRYDMWQIVKKKKKTKKWIWIQTSCTQIHHNPWYQRWTVDWCCFSSLFGWSKLEKLIFILARLQKISKREGKSKNHYNRLCCYNENPIRICEPSPRIRSAQFIVQSYTYTYCSRMKSTHTS